MTWHEFVGEPDGNSRTWMPRPAKRSPSAARRTLPVIDDGPVRQMVIELVGEAKLSGGYSTKAANRSRNTAFTASSSAACA
jgi:hypothetical protein